MSTTLPHMMWHCGLSANLECRSEMCCTRLAENTGRKSRHLCTIAQLCQAGWLVGWGLMALSTTKSCIDNRKNLLNINISSTCLHNMVNFGPLNGWDQLASLGHPNKFQKVSRLGFIIFTIWSTAFNRAHESLSYIQLGSHHVGHRPTF